jgi:hypothetical protein
MGYWRKDFWRVWNYNVQDLSTVTLLAKMTLGTQGVRATTRIPRVACLINLMNGRVRTVDVMSVSIKVTIDGKLDFMQPMG